MNLTEIDRKMVYFMLRELSTTKYGYRGVVVGCYDEEVNRYNFEKTDTDKDKIFQTSIRTRIIRSKDEKMIDVLAKYDTLSDFNRETSEYGPEDEKKPILSSIIELNEDDHTIHNMEEVEV